MTSHVVNDHDTPRRNIKCTEQSSITSQEKTCIRKYIEPSTTIPHPVFRRRASSMPSDAPTSPHSVSKAPHARQRLKANPAQHVARGYGTEYKRKSPTSSEPRKKPHDPSRNKDRRTLKNVHESPTDARTC